MARWKVLATVVVLALLSIVLCLESLSILNTRELRASIGGKEGEKTWFDPLGPYDDATTQPGRLLQLSCLLQQCRPPGTHALQTEDPLLLAAVEAVENRGPTDSALSVAGYSWDGSGARVFVGFRDGELLQRVSMVFPSDTPQLVMVRQIEPLQTVHIIVGIRNRLGQLKRFLQGILAQLLPHDLNFVLHVAYSSAEVDDEIHGKHHVVTYSSGQPLPGYEDVSNHQMVEEDHKHFEFKRTKPFLKDRSSLHKAKQMVQEMLSHVPQLKWTWQVHHSCRRAGPAFSRGCVINSAARLLRPDDLLLLADVDMSLDAEALRRCRANTRQGRQVYFPVAFSLFNPSGPFNKPEKAGQMRSNVSEKISPSQRAAKDDISYNKDRLDGSGPVPEYVSPSDTLTENHNDRKRKKNSLFERDDDHPRTPPFNYPKQKRKYGLAGTLLEGLGFWRLYGFGMVCLHQEDLVRAGELPETLGWGGEDLQFFRELVKLDGMEVLRGAEPGMVHAYHSKDCGEQPAGPTEEQAGVSPDMFPHCLKSKVLAEGSQEALAAAALTAGLLQ